jgi:hypothetical protein
VVAANAVLTVIKLAQDSGSTTRSFDLDTLLTGITSDKGVGTGAKCNQGKSVFHSCELTVCEGVKKF